MIVVANNSTVVFNNLTSRRANVIAKRTGNDAMGVIKSQMIDLLKAKMRMGVAHFVYMKKDGTLREAWGTTNATLAYKYTNGKGVSREIYSTTAYFDIEKSSWRSFRWESIVKVF